MKKNKLTRMLKSKKGQVGIAENISNLLQVTPRPLLIAIFLIILLLFSAVFTFILNGFGVHCSSNDEVYVLPMFDVFRNMQLIFERPALDELSKEIVPDTKILFWDKCFHRQDNGTCYMDGTYCTECEEGDVEGIGGYKTEHLCLGNVYRDENKGWLKKWICEAREMGCDVPIGYFFNQSACGYQCIGTYTTCSHATVGQLWDRKLVDLGGHLLYPVGQEESKAYDKMFKLSCDGMKATFNFYGIPLFDFKITLFLILIVFMVMFFIKIGQVDK